MDELVVPFIFTFEIGAFIICAINYLVFNVQLVDVLAEIKIKSKEENVLNAANATIEDSSLLIEKGKGQL